jgi:hypothetical protein
MKSNSERNGRKASTDAQGSSIVWWSDRRLRELAALAAAFQRAGQSRQAAHVEAYRQMVKARAAEPRRCST